MILNVGLGTSVGFSLFFLWRLLIRCLINVVLPTPISPYKKTMSPLLIKFENFFTQKNQKTVLKLIKNC